jgi:tetratricopeptide (TPR) repeat protein
MMMTDPTSASFGTLLQSFRKRRHLTQQVLADALGIHSRTLGRWEQGDYLPASKALVLELASQLRLDEQETRQLLEASLTALAPYWLVPLPRNLYFTGREEVLSALHTQLGGEQAVALTQSSALSGLGGVGKTQIALEYAYRHALEYSAVFWIGAETEEQIVASLVHIAEALQLPEREDKDQQRVIAAVQRWLSTHGQWLLVWDNVEDLALLDRFMPSTRSGAILLTTRLQALGTLARGLQLAPMEQEEGMLLLLHRAKVLEPEATGEQMRQLAERMPAQYAAATELVAELGGLPLALDQAGAYLEETKCGLPAYLTLLRSQRAALLKLRGEGSRAHPASVSTTFTLAITATAQRHPAVWDLLHVCALLQSDAIPEELFHQSGEYLGALLKAVCCERLEWNRVVGIACNYSLVSRQPEVQTLSIHRLVQAVLLDAMTEAEREQWTRRIIKALDTTFPEIAPDLDTTIWRQCERLLPHAHVCMHLADAEKEAFALTSLAHKVGRYLQARGQFGEAEPLYQKSWHIRESLLGPEHPHVATVLSSLATLYREQGRYEEAEALCQRALRIWEVNGGSDDLEVAATLTYLGSLYVEQGKYEEAELLLLRGLQIREQAPDSNNLQVAHSLNILATIYRRKGSYEHAASLLQRALSIREQALGPEHPRVASPLYNLANLWLEQENYVQAEPLFQRALHIWEQALGPEHPNVAFSLNGLAISYSGQENYVQAEPLFQRALHIWEQALGPEHPHLASPLQELARLYQNQQNYAQAELLFHQALSLRERHLGSCHTETAQTLHDLALFYQKQGHLGRAIPLVQRAYSIRLQTLGNTHPKTVESRMLSTQLLQEQEDAQEESAATIQAQETPDLQREGHVGGEAPLPRPLQDVENLPFSPDGPLRAFLAARCHLHPRAWCRFADLWQAYLEWTENQHERYPLSQRAFGAQLERHGCRRDRTKTARIWRGIALLSKPDDRR